MPGTADRRLEEMGIALPGVPAPVATYVPTARYGGIHIDLRAIA